MSVFISPTRIAAPRSGRALTLVAPARRRTTTQCRSQTQTPTRPTSGRGRRPAERIAQRRRRRRCPATTPIDAAEPGTASPPRSGTETGCCGASRRAPLRMPISRVRSVTDTSMMFMMPMPPTSSDHRGDAGEQRREDVRRFAERRQQIRRVADAKVVGLIERSGGASGAAPP